MIMETAGTLHWMAPELLEERPYNEKVDIWAFGIFVYELTMVNPPFFDQREVCDNVL
jgi:serine/threonine protein kinase